MITITIPFIPFLFAIFAFLIPVFSLIDEEDRFFAFFISTIFQYFPFQRPMGFYVSIFLIIFKKGRKQHED